MVRSLAMLSPALKNTASRAAKWAARQPARAITAVIAPNRTKGASIVGQPGSALKAK